MRLRHDGTHSAKILRALATAWPSPAATTDMIHITEKPWRWDDPAVVRQRSLARLGNELRRLVTLGLAERAGETTDTGWQKAPTHLWRITPAGQDLVAWWDEAPARNAAAAREARRRIAERKTWDELQQERADALSRASERVRREGRLRKPDREIESCRLRQLGCTLREIAAALQVTPECVRLDVIGVPAPVRDKRGQRRSRPRVYSGLGKGRRPKWMHDLEHSSMAGLTEVTFTEI